MPNLAKIMKAEILRLARKEVKRAVTPLRKKVIELSRELSRQKRILALREKKIAGLEKLVDETRPVPVELPPEEIKKARITPRLVKTQRKRLKINQFNFARLLGVSVAAVRSWEQGRSSPRGDNLAAFVAVRKIKLTEARNRLGIKPKRKKRKGRKKRARK